MKDRRRLDNQLGCLSESAGSVTCCTPLASIVGVLLSIVPLDHVGMGPSELAKWINKGVVIHFTISSLLVKRESLSF